MLASGRCCNLAGRDAGAPGRSLADSGFFNESRDLDSYKIGFLNGLLTAREPMPIGAPLLPERRVLVFG